MQKPILITVQLSGQLSVSPEDLKMLLSNKTTPEIPQSFAVSAEKTLRPENSKNKRLAYTMRETAEILGVSYISVHRLIKRGLLKNSKALRTIIIPAAEIERFLKESL